MANRRISVLEICLLSNWQSYDSDHLYARFQSKKPALAYAISLRIEYIGHIVLKFSCPDLNKNLSNFMNRLFKIILIDLSIFEIFHFRLISD